MVHVCEYLDSVATTHPSKVLTECHGQQVTAGQTLLRVAALGRALQQQVGLQSGQTVALAASSTAFFLESLLAVFSIGCIAAPLNLRWDLSEAIKAIDLCGASTVLVDRESSQLLAGLNQTSSGKLKQAVVLGQMPPNACDSRALYAEAMISQHMNAPLQLQHAPEDAALICFTSGTTGQPKAALISHTALDHQSAAKIQVVGYHAQDRYLHAAPLFHIGGLSSAMAVMKAGGTHIFMGKFSAKATLNAIRQHQITAIIAVPAMIADLASEAKASFLERFPNCPSMQRVLVGAGALSQALLRDLQTIFPNAACHSAYGMTEACSSMTFRRLCSPSHAVLSVPDSKQEESQHGTCVGVPPVGIHMAVLTASDNVGTLESANALVNHVGDGEVLTRGPHVFTRYWGQQTATEQAFLPGGWLRTGDMGSIDAKGQVWLVGRLKDIIRTGGETVHPSQVEKVLVQHPSVRAAAVFGVPNERFGEQVAAVIVLDTNIAWEGPLLGSQMQCESSPLTLTSDSLMQFCRQSLSAYKLPRIVAAQYEPLQLNASGKVMKLSVKEQLVAHLNGAASLFRADIISRL